MVCVLLVLVINISPRNNDKTKTRIMYCHGYIHIRDDIPSLGPSHVRGSDFFLDLLNEPSGQDLHYFLLRDKYDMSWCGGLLKSPLVRIYAVCISRILKI